MVEKFTGSVSSKTDFLLAGDNMGPEKRKKPNRSMFALLAKRSFMR